MILCAFVIAAAIALGLAIKYGTHLKPDDFSHADESDLDPTFEELDEYGCEDQYERNFVDELLAEQQEQGEQ